VNLFYFILSSYGLTQLLCYAKLFDKIRPTGYFWRCPMCVGFWVGVFLCGISPLTELLTYELTFVNLLICGWISSGTSYILNMMIGDEGINLHKGGELC
jgi:hypothetical protein